MRQRPRRWARRIGGLAVVALAGGVAWLAAGRPLPAHSLLAAGARVPTKSKAHPKAGQHVLAPPLAQPSVARPLSILEIGDSLGEDLGFGLEALLGGDRRVQLHAEAVGDTGLANVAYYNWPAALARELRIYHPGLVIVFLGGNDDQGFDVGSRPALVGTAFWRTEYSARVATMMHEASAAGAHVLWVGMPVMGPSTGLSPAMATLDAIYAAQARKDPWVRYLSTWRLFENAAHQYATSLPNGAGQLVAMRDPDGVHLTMAGSERAASAVITAIERDWHVRL
jgi:hypothetical protein